MLVLLFLHACASTAPYDDCDEASLAAGCEFEPCAATSEVSSTYPHHRPIPWPSHGHPRGDPAAIPWPFHSHPSRGVYRAQRLHVLRAQMVRPLGASSVSSNVHATRVGIVEATASQALRTKWLQCHLSLKLPLGAALTAAGLVLTSMFFVLLTYSSCTAPVLHDLSLGCYLPSTLLIRLDELIG